MGGWNTIVSFWDNLFSGAMLVSGRVFIGGCKKILGGAVASASFILVFVAQVFQKNNLERQSDRGGSQRIYPP